jgi:hypothetical protein
MVEIRILDCRKIKDSENYEGPAWQYDLT